MEKGFPLSWSLLWWEKQFKYSDFWNTGLIKSLSPFTAGGSLSLRTSLKDLGEELDLSVTGSRFESHFTVFYWSMSSSTSFFFPPILRPPVPLFGQINGLHTPGGGPALKRMLLEGIFPNESLITLPSPSVTQDILLCGFTYTFAFIT